MTRGTLTALRSIAPARTRPRRRPSDAPIRLGVLLTHPVQYYSPWFAHLASRPEFDLRVFYAERPDPARQGEGFNVEFEWDVPLLAGYRHEFIEAGRIRSVIQASGREVWLIPGWGSAVYRDAISACWGAGVPVMTRGDSNLLAPRPPLARAIKRVALGVVMPRFAAFLAVGRRAREYYLHYGAGPRRIYDSPHFIDNRAVAARADLARENIAALREGWGLSPDRVTFLFCGKFKNEAGPGWSVGEAVKRPIDLLRAISSLDAPLRRRAHALMVGDGPDRAGCERFAAEAGLNATFTGFLNQSRIPEAYAASDVLVLPSSVETWGLVVNEAMACGLPAVVTDQVGCAPDLVIDGATGESFPAGDIHTLADKLAPFIIQPELVAHMGARAREHVTTTHTMESATAGLLAACRRALGITHAN